MNSRRFEENDLPSYENAISATPVPLHDSPLVDTDQTSPLILNEEQASSSAEAIDSLPEPPPPYSVFKQNDTMSDQPISGYLPYLQPNTPQIISIPFDSIQEWQQRVSLPNDFYLETKIIFFYF